MPLKVLEQTLGDVRLERNEQAFRPRRQNTLDVLRIVRNYQRLVPVFVEVRSAQLAVALMHIG
jgi:hypothetical protein